ncbi:MAG: nuclear transport factor 2 family protein [Bacteroidales bacterium]|nr:nuclear transport factor 2 family protein [Bacteroidales bacterium]
MRKIVLLLMAAGLFFPAILRADVVFEISEGLSSDGLKTRVERQISRLLTAVNDAAKSGRPVNFSGIDIDDMASFSITQLWANVHFCTCDDEIVTRALRRISAGRLKGYEVRDIEIEMLPLNESYTGAEIQDICIEFDTSGKITDFNLTLGMTTYVQFMREGSELNDLDRRMQILHYVEQFRTAYNKRDLDFLETVFSDDALIITGRVVQRGRSDINLPPEIQYTRQSKRQYLDNLKKNAFDKNKNAWLNIVFDDIRIKRHGSKPNYYGVTLIQHWNASTYSDKGILFLVWDFTDEDKPKIHVRTWQPMETPKEKIITLNDFRLP